MAAKTAAMSVTLTTTSATHAPARQTSEANENDARDDHAMLVVLFPQVAERQRAEIAFLDQWNHFPAVPVDHVHEVVREQPDQAGKGQRRQAPRDLGAENEAGGTGDDRWPFDAATRDILQAGPQRRIDQQAQQHDA